MRPRESEPRHLWRERIAHDVLYEDTAPVDATKFGVGDVVLRDNIRHQGSHADEPSTGTDQHKREDRQDAVHDHAHDVGPGESTWQVDL